MTLDHECVIWHLLYIVRKQVTHALLLQVLMSTAAAHMRRTPSVISPALFTYENHFVFEEVIGRSPYSEVYRAKHRVTGEHFAIKRSMRRFRSRADRER